MLTKCINSQIKKKAAMTVRPMIPNHLRFLFDKPLSASLDGLVHTLLDSLSDSRLRALTESR